MKLIIGVLIVVVACGVGSASPPFRGIAQQDEHLYKTEFIKCKDGSKKFSIAHLNDNFCDCPDGTDEPGTSACPNGRFYCRNAGHSPKVIFSSRVDDGICDCCDGSDESSFECPNTCWQAGKAARDKLRNKISTFQQGLSLRNHLIQQAKSSLAKDQAELDNLKAQEKTLKSLVDHLKAQKEQLDKKDAEDKEREDKRKKDEEAERLLNEQQDKQEKDDEAEPLLNEPEDKQKKDDEAEPLLNEPEDKQEKDDEAERLLNEPEDKQKKDDEAERLLNEPEDKQKKDDEAVRLPNEPEDKQNKDDKADKIGTFDVQQPVVGHVHDDSETVDTKNENEDATHSNDASENSKELSREELGRLVASRWTGENTGKQTEDVNSAEDNNHTDNEDFEETIKDLSDHEHDAYASETDDDHQRYDDDDVNVEDEADDDFREEDPLDSPSSYKYDSDADSEFSDAVNPSNPSLLEKIQQKLRNILKAVSLFQTPVNQSDAAHIRKEYDESSGKLSKIQSRISSLTQKLKHDFGPDKEFYSFYDKCFESKESKYVYKVCPFKHASQEEGHSSTRLGRWDKFDDSYKVMIFSNGDKCWNGPDRSLTVKLRCGLKNEVTDVDEPSRCEYVALLSTPALCFEEKLKELQNKLDEMNKDQPEKHDEL